MFDALAVPFGAKMLFNTVKLKPGITMDDVELAIGEMCNVVKDTYGGAPETAKLESAADYVMKANTGRWVEMGKGEYGPMAAMFFQRLGFDGPMMEAMGNMGPFESFLLLIGKVPSDITACPAK